MNRHPTMPLVREFESRIQEPLFPCVGAKSAMAQHGIGFVLGEDLRSPEADSRIVMALQDFARDAAIDAVFVSKVVLFPLRLKLCDLLRQALKKALNQFAQKRRGSALVQLGQRFKCHFVEHVASRNRRNF